MTAIDCTDLSKAYGDLRAVDDLTLSVEAGEVFGFLGPNGAGKTTIIRLLLGLHHPTGGDAEVLGASIRDRPALRAARARVGYLPSDPGMDPDVTGDTLLDHLGELKGDSRREELVERFGAPVERPIGALSRGNKQKLGVVQAFMHDPELAILDEPTTGLDPLLQETFHEFLREERERGTTVFLSSHTLPEVRRSCDRVGVIRQGELVAVEPVEELLARGGKRVTLRVAEEVGSEDFDLPGVADLSVDDTVRFTFTGEYDRLVDLLDRYEIQDLEIEEAPLEDVFMGFYGAE